MDFETGTLPMQTNYRDNDGASPCLEPPNITSSITPGVPGQSSWLSDRMTRVSTMDLAKAAKEIEVLQGPFSAYLRGREAPRPIRVRAAMCGHVGVSTFSFGRHIEILPRGLAGTILVTTVLKGRAGIILDGACRGAAPGTTFFSQEEDKPQFLYEPDTEVLKLRFDRQRFEAARARLLGQEPRQGLHFEPIAGSAFPSERWLALLRYVVLLLNDSHHPRACINESASIEELLMLTLLSGQPHNQSQPAAACTRVSFPRHYRLAVEFIGQHLAEDITLIQIADAAGCSARSLARVFAQAGSTSPMQYVQKKRLEQIRKDLLDERYAGRTISQVAYDWGYRHLGEFNRQYRLVFGEKPSETRRQMD